MTQKLLFDLDIEPEFTNRRVKAVTFQGKLGLPIHRWYRLTPSFSPDLAWDIAKHFQLSGDDDVLDPFSGVGTVPLCMKYRGIPACSVELNPYLHFVGTIKTRDYDDIDTIAATFDSFMETFRQSLLTMGDADDFLIEHAVDIPRISHPERWWSSGNLAQLVCLRRFLQRFEAEPRHRDLLKMGVLGILVPVSNAKHNHVSLTFAEHPLPRVNVADVLETKLNDIVFDLRSVAKKPRSKIVVYAGNSKQLSEVLPASRKMSAVITSPPYPNRFSYARETRPHLFFFDFIRDAAAVGELETDAIGGTWGKATSVLAKGIEPANEVVRRLLSPYLSQVDDNGQLMASYVTKYFNDMYIHAEQVAKVCRDRCQLAYVIGNSKFYEQPLPSDEILAGLFSHFGFELDRIDRMRKRQSKTGLYEAVVFMHR